MVDKAVYIDAGLMVAFSKRTPRFLKISESFCRESTGRKTLDNPYAGYTIRTAQLFFRSKGGPARKKK